MTFVQRFPLLVFSLLIGCGSPTHSTPVVSLSVSEVARTETSVGTDAADWAANPVAAVQPSEEPLRYTVRKAVTPSAGPVIPRVLLSAGHSKLCSVGVGEAFPAITLPRLGGPQTELASLRGKQATVVLFWHPDRWMARTALIDMQRDIASQFPREQVAVVGIAVRQPMGAVQAALNQAQASFPQLIDTSGEAFTAVGKSALPRIYVLDPDGKIVWFDIEYSEGTRRELWQTLQFLTAN